MNSSNIAAPVPMFAWVAMHDRLNAPNDDEPRRLHRRYAKVLQLQETTLDLGRGLSLPVVDYKPIAGDVVRQLLPEFNAVAWRDFEWTAKSKRARSDSKHY